MLATFKRPPKVNIDTFIPIKSRVNDAFNHMGDKIRSNGTLMLWGGIFAEMLWLADEVVRLGGVPAEGKEKFVKIEKFVRRVNREQEGAIKNGQFMKVGGKVFSAMRFLVSNLETLMLQYLEEDEGMALLEEKVADEGPARISLDLDEGVGDEDSEAE